MSAVITVKSLGGFIFYGHIIYSFFFSSSSGCSTSLILDLLKMCNTETKPTGNPILTLTVNVILTLHTLLTLPSDSVRCPREPENLMWCETSVHWKSKTGSH